MKVFYIIEIIAIELELNEKEKKILSNMIKLNFENSLPGTKNKAKFRKNFISMFGKVKYGLFERWYDSKGIVIDPPERKWLVNDYKYEQKFVSNIKKFIAKNSRYKASETIQYMKYKTALEQAVFKIFMYDSKPSKKMIKTMAAICIYRVNTSKIENQINYLVNCPDTILKKNKNNAYKFFLRKKADYERLHKRMISKLSGIIDKDKHIEFMKVFGWKLK